MKYMGSKKSMLKNGLGKLLVQEVNRSRRFFDPFCGSSSVVWFVAENTDRPVVAGDLQKFSVDLANAILLRDSALDNNNIFILEQWLTLAKCFHESIYIAPPLRYTRNFVLESRQTAKSSVFPVTNAYAGHYFSLDQALKIDSLLKFLPENEPIRSLALASIIEAASHCVAAPGHTAQPFQPKGNGLTAIMEAWKRDPFLYVEKALKDFSTRFSIAGGTASVLNAVDLIENVDEDDLVFLDPPYSGVHYSRFYHVLETISRNSWETVSGKGRYPEKARRPQSDFSLKGKSSHALENLLSKISSKSAKAIVTFPADECSNGLSGKSVQRIASKYFKVKSDVIKGKFSTLGGNNENRPAREESEELVFFLTPK